MNTENLLKACDSFDFFLSELREAHKDAVNAENQFAEIMLLSSIERAAEMQPQLARAKNAVIETAGARQRERHP
jgi:hypothetical protein